MRFFDVVVGDCDETLIAEILKDQPRGQIVSSGRSLKNIPGVEERLPEIRSSAFVNGRPFFFNTVPLITSTGCPNSCDFCIDWNNPYTLLPLDQLEADMGYIFKNFPSSIIAIHDPNFAIQFEKVFDVLEKIPNRGHNTFGMETSLTTLKQPRLERMKKLGKFYIIPGIENWAAYSSKVGAGSAVSPRQKLEKVIEQFYKIRPYVSGIQANFIFGLDVDAGDEPVTLTQEFATRVPFVMPNFNIPVPFGKTPLYDKYAAEKRLLKTMPFTFYYMPYLVFELKNYSAADYYAKLIELITHVSSLKMLLARLRSAPALFPAGYNTVKTLGNRQMISRLRNILNLLQTDSQFRAFHVHQTEVLPRFYHKQYEQLLGSYAELMTFDDRIPLLSEPKKPDLSMSKKIVIKAPSIPAPILAHYLTRRLLKESPCTHELFIYG